MRVLMSGSSGMLGTAIGQALQQKGASLLRLVRRPSTQPNELRWNPEDPGAPAIERPEALESLDAAIHLSGVSVASGRWTEASKKQMRASRVTTTRVLAEALARLEQPPKVLVTASAIGYYGNRGSELLDEDSRPGTGFFPELCTAWEAAAQPAEAAGIRLVHLRFGVVLGPKGGALAQMLPLFRLGLGGPLGSGQQWMSWVSEADVVDTALLALELNSSSGKPLTGPLLAGPVNVVAPVPVTNVDFTRELGHALHRPALLPAPAFALRLVFGQMADEALLSSQRVLPKRLLEAGYRFRYPTLPEALAAALKKE